MRGISSLIFSILLGAVPATQATTLIVSADGTGDFADIVPAVAAAQSGDTVLVSRGLYTGPENTNIDFGGKRLVVRGDLGGSLPVIDCGNVARGFHLHGEEPAGTSIERIRVINGNALNLPGSCGGGIYLTGGECSIIEVEISGCTGGGGGGIRLHEAKAYLNAVTVTNCLGLGDGGGVRASGCPKVILESVSVAGCAAVWGGGMQLGGGDTLIATGLMIADNTAYSDGGGLGITYTGFCELRDCLIEGNVADELGGGLYSYNDSLLHVVDVQFVDNFAGVGGGGAFFREIDGLTVESCLFDGDETNGSGLGGGMRIRNLSNAHVQRCTIARCYAAPARYGGISIGQFADVAVDSCIVALNLGGGGIGTTEYQSFCTVTCSDFFGNEGGNYLGGVPDQTGIAGNISLDPRFCDFADGDFQLAGNSPCLPENNGCAALMGARGQGCSLPTAAPGEASSVGPRLPILEVYPNPMRGELHLSFANPGKAAPCDRPLPLRVVDPSGRTVWEGELEARSLLGGGAKLDLRLQMQWLPAGVYFGQVMDCQGRPHPFRFTLVK